MTLMADEGGLREIKGNPLLERNESSRIAVPPKSKYLSGLVYKRTSIASIKVESDCSCIMGNWTIAHELGDRDLNEQRHRGMSFN